jgi:hypothetical protein
MTQSGRLSRALQSQLPCRKRWPALFETTAGFGVLLGFAHDWANREATMRSWELFARHVVPELNGFTRNLKASAEYVAQHRTELVSGMVQSVMVAVGRGRGCQSRVGHHNGKARRVPIRRKSYSLPREREGVRAPGTDYQLVHRRIRYARPDRS